MSDGDGNLVELLEKVQSDLGFRRQTRRRMSRITFFVLLDIFASATALVAIIKVNDNAEQIERSVQNQCERDNQQRTDQVDLWVDVVAQQPAPVLPADATPVQIAEHDEALRRTAVFVASVRSTFALEECP